MNNTISSLDLSQFKEHTFFSNVHGTLKKHDHVLTTQIITNLSKGRDDMGHILWFFFFFCTNLVFNNKERRERKREQKNMEGDRPS